jgi:pimeloyl-[acyl-carrier protein] methyl ester esterase
VKLLLVHGWGFDASLWDGVRAALKPIEALAWDLGYFGAERGPEVAGPFIAVGHSLGSLLLAAEPPPGCAGTIAINGFDRFTGDDRVPARVLDRMRARFAAAPDAVLDEFRLRCGGSSHQGALDTARLGEDLERLATWDARGGKAPMVVLQGADDPILSAAMQDHVFPGAPRAVLAGGGHLLPITHPEWCAKRIEEALRERCGRL